MLHHKTMVVDGVWATVGTTNFDNRSFAHNDENNVCVYDAAWAQELHDIFIRDLEGCDMVTLASWRARGLVEKGDGDLRVARTGPDLIGATTARMIMTPTTGRHGGRVGAGAVAFRPIASLDLR